MSENPLFDGNLSITIGGHAVTGALLPGLSYSSTNPGGFGEATLRFEATSPWSPYVTSGHTVARGDAVVIQHSSQVLFQGTIISDVSHADIVDGSCTYNVNCAGLWWSAERRKDYCRIIGDEDYGQWYIGPTSDAAYTFSTEGQLKISLEEGGSVGQWKWGELIYWLDSGLGSPISDNYISAMIFDMHCNLPVNWYADIQYTETNPWDPWELMHVYPPGGATDARWSNQAYNGVEQPHVCGGPGSVRAICVRIYPSVAIDSAADDVYIKLTRLALRHNLGPANATVNQISTGNPARVHFTAAHGIGSGDRICLFNTNSTPTINGWHSPTIVDSTHIDIGTTVTGAGTTGWAIKAYKVDEAMSLIARSTGLATSSDLQSGGIGGSHWGMNIRPVTSRAEALTSLAGMYSAPIDYGFWNGAVFYCKERIAPTGGTNDYLIDSSDPGIDFSVYKNTESTPDAVKILYLLSNENWDVAPAIPDGTLCDVYRPSEPTWSDAAKTVSVWNDWANVTMTEAEAQGIGDQILDWLDANAYTGTITITTPTVPKRGGGTKNAAYIRAGEYIEDSNLDTGPLMITAVSVDVDSGVVTLTIGETAASFKARLRPRVVMPEAWTWMPGTPDEVTP